MLDAEKCFLSKYDEYDLVISLGGNCAVASQLRHRGKRSFSLPFDWALMSDDAPIRYLAAAFGNRFEGFLKYENVEEFEPPANEFGQMALRVRDAFSGYKFIHQFHGRQLNRSIFEKERSVIQKRIDRLYEKVGRSTRVLFVLQTAFTFDVELAKRLRAGIVEAFPGVEIELRVMQFGAEAPFSKIEEDGLLRIYGHASSHNIVYDNQMTAPEWCWMDEIRVRALPLPEERRKSSLLMKWKFKIWMHLGKSLEDDGTGCACMRFYKFGRYYM